MKILFAAPENAWQGFLDLLRSDLPHHHIEATGEFTINDLAGFDVLIPAMSAVTEKVLSTADRLKLIQQCGAGLDKVDLTAAARMHIPVANVPTDISGNADSVAELGVFFMIGLLRDVRKMHENLQKRIIGEPSGSAFAGKTVGIIGLGGIGRSLAKRLKPFDTSLIGLKRSNPQRTGDELGLAWAGGPAELYRLLHQSDFVVLCLPLLPETRNLMDRDAFAHMKPGAFLINLSRGGLVDPIALREALVSGKIGGAGLDVFWEEPPDPQDPIFSYNVIATPHIAGTTDRSLQGIRSVITENICRLEMGLVPLYVRNSLSNTKPPDANETIQ